MGGCGVGGRGDRVSVGSPVNSVERWFSQVRRRGTILVDSRLDYEVGAHNTLLVGTVGEHVVGLLSYGVGFQNMQAPGRWLGAACVLRERLFYQTQQLVQQDWGGGYTL